MVLVTTFEAVKDPRHNIDYKFIERQLRPIKDIVMNSDYSIEYLKARINGEIFETECHCNDDERKYLQYIKDRMYQSLNDGNIDGVKVKILAVLYANSRRALLQSK